MKGVIAWNNDKIPGLTTTSMQIQVLEQPLHAQS